MRSGNLKHKIVIESYAETKNAVGEVTKEWSEFATTYSSIVPLSGNEKFSSNEVHAEVTHKIEMRFISGVLPKMRVVYGSRNFDIKSAINIREQNRTLYLMCSEVIDG